MTVTDIRPNPFTPKGERPKWEPVYELLLTKRVEDVVTYAELSVLLGYNFPDGDRSPLYVASKHFLRDKGRVLRNVQNVGYRVAQATEHETVVRTLWNSGNRRFRRGKAVAHFTDRSELTAEQAARLDTHELRISQLEETSRRTIREVKRHEKALEAVVQKTDVTDERVRRLEEELAKIKAGG